MHSRNLFSDPSKPEFLEYLLKILGLILRIFTQIFGLVLRIFTQIFGLILRIFTQILGLISRNRTIVLLDHIVATVVDRRLLGSST